MNNHEEMEQLKSYISGVPIEVSIEEIQPELLGLMGMDGEFHGDDEEEVVNVWPDRILKSGNATIVFWADGDKTVVKRSPDEPDNDYNAFCASLGVKVFGSNSQLKKVIRERTEVQKQKKQKDACPIDKPCKAEHSSMEHELGSLNDLARKQYEEFQKQNAAKDEWICPKCGGHYQWHNSAEGRYAFCPKCQLAAKDGIKA